MNIYNIINTKDFNTVNYYFFKQVFILKISNGINTQFF